MFEKATRSGWNFFGSGHDFEQNSASALVVILGITVSSTALLAYWRRAKPADVDLAFYWLGCSTVTALAIGSFFAIAGRGFAAGFRAGVPIVVVVAAILAYWRPAVVGRRLELWIYGLGIASLLVTALSVNN